VLRLQSLGRWTLSRPRRAVDETWPGRDRNIRRRPPAAGKAKCADRGRKPDHLAAASIQLEASPRPLTHLARRARHQPRSPGSEVVRNFTPGERIAALEQFYRNYRGGMYYGPFMAELQSSLRLGFFSMRQ